MTDDMWFAVYALTAVGAAIVLPIAGAKLFGLLLTQGWFLNFYTWARGFKGSEEVLREAEAVIEEATDLLYAAARDGQLTNDEIRAWIRIVKAKAYTRMGPALTRAVAANLGVAVEFWETIVAKARMQQRLNESTEQTLRSPALREIQQSL